MLSRSLAELIMEPLEDPFQDMEVQERMARTIVLAATASLPSDGTEQAISANDNRRRALRRF